MSSLKINLNLEPIESSDKGFCKSTIYFPMHTKKPENGLVSFFIETC